MANKYAVRKFDGDDVYSWAVFLSRDVRGKRGVVFWGEAQPISHGLSRQTALYTARQLNGGKHERAV